MARAKTGKASAPLPARPAADRGPETPMTKQLAGWLVALAARADAGDAAACRELVAAYDAVPRLWERAAVLQDSAEQGWLDLLLAPDSGRLFTREAMRRDLARLRRELAGPEPTPLERLLVDRIVVGWMNAAYAEAAHAQRLREGLSLREAEFHQRRTERAQRQLLRAVQALATVRRLLGPVVQVNIADKQVNVAG